MTGSLTWEVRGGRVLGPAPFFVLGVLNVTPDSFYDGGKWVDSDSAAAHARNLIAQGAHILDIGGESTRPFSLRITAEEELSRVTPLVRMAASFAGPDGLPFPVSVDTYKATVAAAALDAGAVIINDVSAFGFDPELLDVLAEYRPGYVLMHCPERPETMQRNPRYANVLDALEAFFEAKLAQLVAAGLPEDRVVLDPGIGFGKTLAHNLTILRHVERFTRLGRPMMVGLSNKSLFGDLLGLDVRHRGNATQAATAVLATKGVRIHRVHEVDLTVQTLRVAGELAKTVS